mmetsp:Transcript_10049/g.33480  ORF Transcript_10049/g.33480 Transcript_10049/m.33480 type:complete len:96 (-) Transcript_10049:1020-1307(-)
MIFSSLLHASGYVCCNFNISSEAIWLIDVVLENDDDDENDKFGEEFQAPAGWKEWRLFLLDSDLLSSSMLVSLGRFVFAAKLDSGLVSLSDFISF